MTRPIQVKPADSESRGGSSLRDERSLSHSDFPIFPLARSLPGGIRPPRSSERPRAKQTRPPGPCVARLVAGTPRHSEHESGISHRVCHPKPSVLPLHTPIKWSRSIFSLGPPSRPRCSLGSAAFAFALI
ncbi:hypothetical protein SKAU_G00304540 [Synaphobranchus kaupii]|uniref:Uncharacterized protein n=1 Tax=Synaphobranchus kaupii TaxID=118154 RepID=A0A9Q1EWG2_SYNKA|nr:hypothetical protein SKAU_G00304540 [Synaphobranchus kaupii]